MWRMSLIGVCWLLGAATWAAESLPLDQRAALRRPIALALVDGGQRLLVANRETGTISRIDTATKSLLDEIAVAKKLADLVVVPDSGTILAIDGLQHALIVLRQDEKSIAAIARVRLPHTPVRVTVSKDGRRCFVSALWSRQLHVVDLAQPRRPRILKTIDLKFSPREQVSLDDGRTLIVADAFGGCLAAIDVGAGRMISTHAVDGHNIRGLAISANGQRLLLAHQNLNPNVATSGFNVHWGGVMQNMISEVRIADLLQDGDEMLPIADVEYLGFRDEAAGDPGPLLLGPGGERMIALAGVSEIAFSPNATSVFTRIAVGRRPSALATSADGESVYTANLFGDSVSVVSIPEAKVVQEISLGPQPQLDLSQRGEMLFYDARLSSDGWYSCHSCHIDGHSNGLLNDNFGDGSFDAVQSEQYDSPLRTSRAGPRRVLSLLGVASTRPWAWDGNQLSLWGQIRKSIEITMQGPSPPETDVTAIENFLYTLQPPPSVSVARGKVDRAAAARGKRLFERHSCSDCHQPPSYTSPATYDVGLKDKSGNRQFNPPSLLGASQRSTFFHDGRSVSLRQVFQQYQHNLDEPLPSDEVDDLVEFVESL